MKESTFRVCCRLGKVLFAGFAFACAGPASAPTPGSGGGPPVIDAGVTSDSRPSRTDTLPPIPGLTPDTPAERFTPLPADVLAKRLVRLLWDQTDVPASLVADLAGQSLDGDRIAAIAESMLSDPRGEAGVRAFFRHWLDTNTGLRDFASWPKEARAEVEESAALGAHITRAVDGTYADLLSAPFTFVNEALAPRYGLSDVRGEEWRKIPYPAGQNRFGLLTGAGILSRFATVDIEFSWPAKRSWMILDQILCFGVPKTFLETPPPDANKSIRQQMIEVTAPSNCMACHQFLNSPGFAFIGFDREGRWRPAPGHGPDETKGWLPALLFADEPQFDGPEQLARLLIERPRAAQCLANSWLQYAVDPKELPLLENIRTPSVAESLPATYGAFVRSGFRLKALLIAVARSKAVAGTP
ncbi:MAG TPA: DUF1588 domain-containing protein [Polyangia bacterium]